MKLTFLEASVPLTKSYEKKQGDSYVGGSYPGVTNFTSHVEEISNLASFSKAMKKHSAQGHCLLTNSLSRQIKHESRAKLSDKEELRKWILLDIDGIDGVADTEDFIQKYLPAQFHDTSYVMQHSPSSGIKPGIRIHIFFLLYDETDVTSVSAWLKYTNLVTRLLSDQITLSKNSMALSLKLDWVANNNGRLIYITPPECKNFDDPVDERITLVEKKYDSVSFNFAAIGTGQMRAKYREKLNELRGAAGLKVSRKDEYYIIRGDHEIVRDDLVEGARITTPQADNERFMRCNLDGGDSYAYYYYRDSPTYLYNFKGEPIAKLKKLDPEYYHRVAKPDMEKLREKDERPFIFRDHNSDKYLMGIRKEDDIVVQPTEVGGLNKIDDYYAQFGNGAPPSPIPTWTVLFNPEINKQWDADARIFNTWRPTKYQTEAMSNTTMPETIDRVIRHVLNDDKETYDHFINWLAFIYQTRTKSGTAWVLHGCPGTGKGVLFNNIIRPIFGDDYCQTKQIRDLRDSFNGWMENALFVNVDEAHSDDAGRDAKEIVNALKQWITDPVMSVRHMRTTARNCRSYINFVFTTNDFGILPIQDGDRRFSVAPRQERPIVLDTCDLGVIRDELQEFAGFLAGYNVSESLAHTPLVSEAKDELKTAAESSLDTFFRACREGDLGYFIAGLEETTHEHESLSIFRLAVEEWTSDVKADRQSQVTHIQMKHVHIVMCRHDTMKLGAFVSMCAKRGFASKKRRGQGERSDARWLGWAIDWNVNDELKRDMKIHLRAVKTDAQIEADIANEIKGE